MRGKNQYFSLLFLIFINVPPNTTAAEIIINGVRGTELSPVLTFLSSRPAAEPVLLTGGAGFSGAEVFTDTSLEAGGTVVEAVEEAVSSTGAFSASVTVVCAASVSNSMTNTELSAVNIGELSAVVFASEEGG